MNTEETRRQDELYDDLRTWLELQIEIEEKSPEFGCPQEFRSSLEKLGQMLKEARGTTVSAEALVGRVRVLLKYAVNSVNRVSTPDLDYNRPCSFDATDEVPERIYKNPRALKVAKQDLLALIKLEGGIDLFAMFFFRDTHHRSRDEGKALDAMLYRVWVSYFRENPSDPVAHLYRANLLHRMLVEPDNLDWLDDPDYEEHLIASHEKDMALRETGRRYLDEGSEEAKQILITDYAAAKKRRVKSAEELRLSPDAWRDRVRNKIVREIAEANRLAGDNSEIQATGILIRPQPIIEELYRLYKEKEYKTLYARSFDCYKSIEKFQEISGIDYLSDRKTALQQLALHYALSAAYALRSKKVFKIVTYIGEAKFKVLSEAHPIHGGNTFDLKCRIAEFEDKAIFDFADRSMAWIVTDCSPAFLAKMLSTGLGRSFYTLFNLGLAANLEDFWREFEAGLNTKRLDSVDTTGIDEVLLHYPEYQGSLKQTVDRDGYDLFSAKLKLALLDCISFGEAYSIRKTVNNLYLRLAEKRMKQLVEEKYKARLDERTQVISELSHHVKNLLSSVTNPLSRLLIQSGENKSILEDALRGTRLIREIVNASSLSFAGSQDDFRYDFAHVSDSDIRFDSLLEDALNSALGHMLDSKYFNKFASAYFPTRESLYAAEQAWLELQSLPHEKQLSRMCEIFGSIQFEVKTQNLPRIGNQKGSALKLMIVVQELLLNAVKFVAFTEKNARAVRIIFNEVDGHLVLSVQNSFQPKKQTKTTGLGHTFMNNMIELMGAIKEVDANEGTYSVFVQFPRFMTGYQK